MAATRSPAAPPMQVPLPLMAAEQGRFETFLPGPNLSVLQQLASQLPPAQPLYLWGDAGSGKTHLLQALAHGSEARGVVVQWVDPSQPGPWELSSRCQLLLVDDADRLPAEQQQNLFALLIEAQAQACVWASAGRMPPVDLPLRDDLRSRLAWGQTHALHTLNEEQTLFALGLEAERRGIELSPEVQRFLISRLSRDLTSLMQLLECLDHYSLARGRAVTVPLLRDMLASGPGTVAPRADA